MPQMPQPAPHRTHRCARHLIWLLVVPAAADTWAACAAGAGPCAAEPLLLHSPGRERSSHSLRAGHLCCRKRCSGCHADRHDSPAALVCSSTLASADSSACAGSAQAQSSASAAASAVSSSTTAAAQASAQGQTTVGNFASSATQLVRPCSCTLQSLVMLSVCPISACLQLLCPPPRI